jgi:hypothetical protein
MRNTYELTGQSFSHSDQGNIDNWILYGPKNNGIESLMREWALAHGLRIADVESEMLRALREMREEFEADG